MKLEGQGSMKEWKNAYKILVGRPEGKRPFSCY
jgi:hypothetical protein